MASSFNKFLYHTQRRTTFGRTPLDEWSARLRDLYLTTHNTHNRQTSMPSVRFEPTISAGELLQTYAWDCAVNRTDLLSIYARHIWITLSNASHNASRLDASFKDPLSPRGICAPTYFVDINHLTSFEVGMGGNTRKYQMMLRSRGITWLVRGGGGWEDEWCARPGQQSQSCSKIGDKIISWN